MANYRIFSNNPRLAHEAAHPIPGGVLDVYLATRDAIHLGAELISHPLAGSLKPNETPYRSITLSTRRGPVDARSLQIIEDAIATLRKLPEKNRPYTPQMLDDFAVIDLDLVQSAMAALPAHYHTHP